MVKELSVHPGEVSRVLDNYYPAEGVEVAAGAQLGRRLAVPSVSGLIGVALQDIGGLA